MYNVQSGNPPNVQNRAPETEHGEEAPLTEDELDAIQNLANRGLNPDQISADAATASQALENAIAQSADDDSGDDTAQNRKCRAQVPSRCRVCHPKSPTGAGIHAQKGGRASGGKPKAQSRQQKQANAPDRRKPAPNHELEIHDMEYTEEKTRQILSRKKERGLADKDGTRIGKEYMGAVAPGMDKEFFITGGSIQELLYRIYAKRSADLKSHYAAAAHVAELWENSQPLSKERDRYKPYKKSDIEWVHKRTARMRIGSNLYKVIITAKEMKNPEKKPHRLYHVRTKKIDE